MKVVYYIHFMFNGKAYKCYYCPSLNIICTNSDREFVARFFTDPYPNDDRCRLINGKKIQQWFEDLLFKESIDYFGFEMTEDSNIDYYEFIQFIISQRKFIDFVE